MRPQLRELDEARLFLAVATLMSILASSMRGRALLCGSKEAALPVVVQLLSSTTIEPRR